MSIESLQAKVGVFGPFYGVKKAKKINIYLVLLHSTLSDKILSGKIFVGQSFRHSGKNSLLLPDYALLDKVNKWSDLKRAP